MKIQYQDIADLLGIDLQGAKIYLELMIHDSLSVDKLQVFSGLSKKVIDSELRKLLQMNLVKKFQSGSKKTMFQTISLFQLEEKLERDKIIFQNLKKIVVPAVNQQERLGIIKYEGIEGIRKVFLEILEEAKKTGEDILALESGLDVDVLGDAFIHNYVNRRVTSKIKAFVITPDSFEDKKYKEEHEGKYTSIKMLPKFKIRANINIVGNLVMTFSLSPLHGTLRRDKDEASTLKEVFWRLWKD